MSGEDKEKEDIGSHDGDIRKTLEEQLENHREAHYKQLSRLREEIEDEQRMPDEPTDLNQGLLLEQERLMSDYNKLKTEEQEKDAKLRKLM
ncbi:kinesin heavy chain-like [Cheilinus undulatus]|uniref:kinesin heavy chain-like n=1 Tax=Cheilinus undulatus TaxID=241271 RepID=UPI001BD43F34|nr:kinesin heavy chain-like [Cheilinus undulatus]XP_041639681.1 kinesin heavy chain-like [Cheilinus undulatus]